MAENRDMSRHHFVRVGALGHVGRFTSVDAVSYPRDAKVIVRTSRGLEAGEILGPAADTALRGATDGSILRGMTDADELLKSRLEKNRQQAIDACTARLSDRKINATLLDIEHLFDGRSLFFYFLGEVTPEIESITAELAEVYDAAAQFRKFSETLAEGCGPGCGTDEATGHGGCTLCATACAVSGACGVKHK
jgi:cell fate regulator YaaT (PSP1 superfamily)